MSPPDHESDDRRLTTMLRSLLLDTETLLFQEAALMRAELTESALGLVQGSAILLVGIELGLLGLAALIGAAIALMSETMSLWLACVLASGVALGIATILILWGRHSITRVSLVPRKSWQSLRETASWAEEELT